LGGGGRLKGQARGVKKGGEKFSDSKILLLIVASK